MSIFFGYLYKKKPFRALKHTYTHTPVHPRARAPHIMRYLCSRAHNPFELVRYFNLLGGLHHITFEGSNVYRPVYFYIEKTLKMSTFLVTYIRKNPFELSNICTPIHPYTIICSGALTFCTCSGLSHIT